MFYYSLIDEVVVHNSRGYLALLECIKVGNRYTCWSENQIIIGEKYDLENIRIIRQCLDKTPRRPIAIAVLHGGHAFFMLMYVADEYTFRVHVKNPWGERSANDNDVYAKATQATRALLVNVVPEMKIEFVNSTCTASLQTEGERAMRDVFGSGFCRMWSLFEIILYSLYFDPRNISTDEIIRRAAHYEEYVISALKGKLPKYIIAMCIYIGQCLEGRVLSDSIRFDLHAVALVGVVVNRKHYTKVYDQRWPRGYITYQYNSENIIFPGVPGSASLDTVKGRIKDYYLDKPFGPRNGPVSKINYMDLFKIRPKDTGNNTPAGEMKSVTDTGEDNRLKRKRLN